MRTELRALSGRRLRFTARVGRRSNRRTRSGNQTILLEDIRHRGQVVADHIWVSAGYWSEGLEQGDEVVLQAGVRSYRKGDSHDYSLGNVWLL